MNYNDDNNQTRLQAWELRMALYDAEIKIPVTPYLRDQAAERQVDYFETMRRMCKRLGISE